MDAIFIDPCLLCMLVVEEKFGLQPSIKSLLPVKVKHDEAIKRFVSCQS